MATNNQINIPTPFPVNKGGTGVASVTIAPTASAWAGWDANKNFSAVGFIPGYTTTVTSASPVTLTVGSNQQQYFTGSTAQSLTMPVANTLVVGQYWSVINNSSAIVTIKSSGGNTIIALPANSETTVTCVTASGTDATSWTTSPAVSGSGTVNSGLINQLAWYASSGTAVSGLATANSSGLLTNGSGVPAWVTVTGTGAPVLATSPTLVTPILGVAAATSLQITGANGIYDSNNNLIFALAPIASAVNSIATFNNSTGNGPGLGVQGSDTNITLSVQGKGTGGVTVQGTGTNDNAGAGYIGEFMSASNLFGAPIVFTSTVAKTLQSITLTAGDWDVWGNIFFAGTTTTSGQCGLHTTTNVLPDNSLTQYIAPLATSQDIGVIAPQRRFSVNGSTTIYLVGTVTGTGTLNGSGGIYARRVR